MESEVFLQGEVEKGNKAYSNEDLKKLVLKLKEVNEFAETLGKN